MVVIGHKDGSIEKVSSSRFTQKTKGFPTHTVIGGEFAVGQDDDDIAFKTLLGSCVALMFYDKKKKVKSMNHFLLPKTESNQDDMKYGLYSVEAMLNGVPVIAYRKGGASETVQEGITGEFFDAQTWYSIRLVAHQRGFFLQG